MTLTELPPVAQAGVGSTTTVLAGGRIMCGLRKRWGLFCDLKRDRERRGLRVCHGLAHGVPSGSTGRSKPARW
jgi:hypothetical protein